MNNFERYGALCLVLQRFQKKNAPNVLYTATQLHRLAKRCEKNAVDMCNIPNYADKRNKLREQAEKILTGYDLTFTVGGDPRGYCFKLFGKGLDGNTMGGRDDGWGV